MEIYKIRIGLAAMLITMAIFAIVMPVEAAYDRGKAKLYMDAYTFKYNSEYRDFSQYGDCTNFASQVLLAGGWTETGKYSSTSDDAWYYDAGYSIFYSNSWSVVNNLYNFMSRHPERATRVTLTYPWSAKLMPGDIVQIDYHDQSVPQREVPDGRWDHSYVVYRVLEGVGDDLILAAHDADTNSEPFSNVKKRFPGARFVGWHIK